MKTALGCLLGLTVEMPASALNEPSHELINEVAAKYQHFDKSLRSLGFSGGAEELVAGLAIVTWIRGGGTHEDEGSILNRTARFLRHFHDPLQPWGEAGLDLGVARYDSSIRWMQRPNQQAEARGTGNWSWSDARRYVRDALTAPNSDTRQDAWADTFRALGQIMHLVVDASVPEHVRNDPHPLGFLYGNYEYWVQERHGTRGSTKEGDFIRRYLSRPKGFDARILHESPTDDIARVPIARLIDTDRYTGQDPSVTVGETIGIAEVANANFFSEDTHEGEYPFPSVALLQRSKHPAPLTGVARAYYKKGVGDGFQVDPVLAECVLDRAGAGPPGGPIFRCTDENVWNATASEMLPRAVGYARGVLDYFFRGKLSATLHVDKREGAFHAEVRIKNQTPDEDMTGRFEVYYDLRDGTRKLLASWDLVLGRASSDFSLSEPLIVSPLPPDTPPTAWTVVFQGRLGEEAGAVAATRLGTQYAGQVVSYRTSSSEYSGFYDISAYWPDRPYLAAVDKVTLRAGGYPAGVGPDGVSYPAGFSVHTVRETRVNVFYRDPTATSTRVEVTPTSGSVCGGYDSLYYGEHGYQWLNYTRFEPFTFAGADLVEFEAPATLEELYGYSDERPPRVRRILRSGLGAYDGPFRVDVTGVRILGLRLTSTPGTPGIPEDVGVYGMPEFTSLRLCQVVVEVHFVD